MSLRSHLTERQKSSDFKRSIVLAGLLLLSATSVLAAQIKPLDTEAPGSGHGLKESACSVLGPSCRAVKIVVLNLIGLVRAAPNDGHYWVYLLVAFLTAALVYAVRLPRRRDFSLSEVFRFVFPKSVYGHASAITDYKYYVTTAFVDPLVSVVIAGGAAIALTSRVANALTWLFGPMAAQSSPGWTARCAYTVLLVMAIDLGYFVFHYLAHRIEFLWEFHKVHHAAEVLTPFTGYRNHPIDNLVQQTAIGAVVGVLNGAMVYWYQRPPDIVTILGTSAVLFVYNLTANLRHSHVWLSYGNFTSYILSSPAQHQIHHSCEERHLDTNFGRVLSLWDWMAGTLYVPNEREEFRLGLRNEEHREYVSLWGCYVLPFIKAFRGLTNRKAVVSDRAVAGEERLGQADSSAV